MRDPLAKVKAAERKNLLIARKGKWRVRFDDAMAWMKDAKRFLKRTIEVISLVGKVLGAIGGVLAGWKALQMYHARDVGRPELPANHVPSTALDFLGPGYVPEQKDPNDGTAKSGQ